MELIFFLIFFGLIIFFTTLGFWRKDFLAMYVAGFTMVILGTMILTGGITYIRGEVQELDSLEYYHYITPPDELNHTHILSTLTITPIEITQTDEIVTVMGWIFILVAIYLVYLAITLTPQGDEE